MKTFLLCCSLSYLALFCLNAPVQAAPAEGELLVRVAAHDTLIGISRKLLARPAQWPRLQKLNRIADPYRLQPGSLLRIPESMLAREAVQARLESVSGEVRGTAGVALQAGTLLGEGDELTTGPASYAVLVLPDGARTLVQPESTLHISRLLRLRGAESQQSRVDIRRGRIESEVPAQRGPGARYEIHTPTAVIGVRGTRFRTAWDGQVVRVEVTDGAVAANRAQAGDTRVSAGQGAVLDAAGARTAALLATPAMTGVPALFERPLIRLPLPDTPGAVAHRVIVAGAAGFEQPAAEVLASGKEARITDLPDGEYRLRLRGVDANGLEGLEAESAFRLKARPEPPFASQPLLGAKLQGEVELRWTEQPQAARYRLQIAGDAGFDPPLVQADELSQTRHALTLPPGNYQWRLASTRSDGDRGPWGDPLRFTVKPPQAPPEPPAIGPDSLGFAWPGEAGQRFEFVLARDAQFGSIVQRIDTTEPRLSLPIPEAGEYFVRVRASDPDGFVSQWSAPQRFVVEASHPWWLLGLLPLLLLIP